MQSTMKLSSYMNCDLSFYEARGWAVGWGTETTSRKVAGSIPDGVIGIFNFPAALRTWSLLNL